MFVCFIEFSKAFDKVNYWKLFRKLLDDGVNTSIVSLLAYWYTHQQACVLWMHMFSLVRSLLEMVLSKVVFYPLTCLLDIFVSCLIKKLW